MHGDARLGSRRSRRSAVIAVLAATMLIAASIQGHAAISPTVTIREVGTPGQDTGKGVVATADALYGVGDTSGTFSGQTSQGGTDAYVTKRTLTGTHLWTLQFGTSEGDSLSDVATDGSSVYVGGSTSGAIQDATNAGASDLYVARITPVGDVDWETQIGSDQVDTVNAIAVSNGSVFIAGISTGALPGQGHAGTAGLTPDLFVAKLNAETGALQWLDEYGTDGSEYAHGIYADGSGVYVVGQAQNGLGVQTSPNIDDAFLIRYDPADGDRSLIVLYGEDSTPDTFTDIDGVGSSLYVTGYTLSATPWNPNETAGGDYDGLVVKLSRAGDIQWGHLIASNISDTGQRIAAGGSGIYVGGDTVDPDVLLTDAYVSRYSYAGRQIWTHVLATSEADSSRGGLIAAPSGAFLFGSTAGSLPGVTNFGGSDAFLARFTSARPDGHISLAATSGYIGNDVYNSTAARQTKTAGVAKGRAKTFYIRGQNDGDSTDSIKIKGCGSSRGFAVTYLSGTTNVTSAVVGGSFRLNNVRPGATKTLKARISVARSVSVNATKSCTIALTSVSKPTLKDVVKAVVRAKA